jgi:hypothetical protein
MFLSQELPFTALSSGTEQNRLWADGQNEENTFDILPGVVN